MKKAARGVTTFFSGNMAILYFLVTLCFSVMFLPNFANINNINALIRQAPVPIIRALASCFILVLANVDLSRGYIVGVGSVAMGMMLDAGLDPTAVILLGLLIGAAFGLLNGLLVSAINVPSFIVTLGSGYIAYGLCLVISGGKQYSNLNTSFLAFARTRLFGYPLAVYYAIILTLIVMLIFQKTIYGRTLQSMGLNPRATYLSGLRTRSTLLSSFVVAAVLSAFAAVLLTVRTNVAQQSLGGLGDFTFEGVTACVLGGTSLSGGVVNVPGVFFAALTIMLIENIITILYINRYFYQPVLGIIILFAVLVDSLKSKRSH
jgi:ribose/xylose/arabinose/galactoside ABC-type transport system permease subunit